MFHYLIVILGSTGPGKTKLSNKIATKFKGEVIGAYSMQVHKGLDIVTAKATKEEQSQPYIIYWMWLNPERLLLLFIIRIRL